MLCVTGEDSWNSRAHENRFRQFHTCCLNSGESGLPKITGAVSIRAVLFWVHQSTLDKCDRQLCKGRCHNFGDSFVRLTYGCQVHRELSNNPSWRMRLRKVRLGQQIARPRDKLRSAMCINIGVIQFSALIIRRVGSHAACLYTPRCLRTTTQITQSGRFTTDRSHGPTCSV